MKILLVEDSEPQARMLGLRLKGLDYEVRTACNGREGLKALEKSLPDLILTNVVMPVMNGYAFCEKLKANPKTRDIPVVLLSSMNKPLSSTKELPCGADDFIAKPYQFEQLKSRIEQILENKKQAPDSSGKEEITGWVSSIRSRWEALKSSNILLTTAEEYEHLKSQNGQTPPLFTLNS